MANYMKMFKQYMRDLEKYNEMLKHYKSGICGCSYNPLHIYIEPTNRCNLSCSHCTNRKSGRPKGNMNIDFYRNLIKQSEDLDIKWIYLFYHGEPLLHPHIKDMVDIAHNHGRKIRMHSNGILPLEDLEIDELHISKNETPFSRLEKNLRSLVDVGQDFIIDVIEGYGTSDDIPEKFKPFVYKKQFYNWTGKVGTLAFPSSTVCSHPYKSMIVMWDGKCIPCCPDGEADYVIGDSTRVPLSDIWNSQKMKKIRRKPVGICSFCNIKRTP